MKDILLDGECICRGAMAGVIFRNLTGENFPGGRDPVSPHDTHEHYLAFMETCFEVSFAGGELTLVGSDGVEQAHQFGEVPYVPVESVAA